MGATPRVCQAARRPSQCISLQLRPAPLASLSRPAACPISVCLLVFVCLSVSPEASLWDPEIGCGALVPKKGLNPGGARSCGGQRPDLFLILSLPGSPPQPCNGGDLWARPEFRCHPGTSDSPPETQPVLANGLMPTPASQCCVGDGKRGDWKSGCCGHCPPSLRLRRLSDPGEGWGGEPDPTEQKREAGPQRAGLTEGGTPGGIGWEGSSRSGPRQVGGWGGICVWPGVGLGRAEGEGVPSLRMDEG